MADEDIKILNKWFERETEVYAGTYHHTKEKDGEDLYNVDPYDVSDFVDFIGKEFPDIIGIPCIVGDMGIWFRGKDLKDVTYV